MSFQSSSHFDSTTLLIVRSEIDNTIKNVETGVSNLLEDGTVPFGLDDNLTSLEQCSQVLYLVEQPYIGKLIHLTAEVMKKIIQDAGENKLQHSDVEAMSEATNVAKRYLDFLCVREIRAPQFLISTINKLEQVLGLPFTSESIFIQANLATMQPNVQFEQPTQLPPTQYVSRLYKLSLLKLLQEKETDLDFQAFSLCGNYLASAAQGKPSEKFWGYVHLILSQLQNTIITEPRLRILINIEKSIRAFLDTPDQFEASQEEINDVIALTLSQDTIISQQIREQLNIMDDMMSDDQLQVLSRQLYGPDLQTIETIVTLLSDQLKELSARIETSQYHHNVDERNIVFSQLNEISNVLDVINLNDAAKQLREQSIYIRAGQNLDSAQHASQMMSNLLFATNSLQILERNFTSNRLKLKLNNSQITLEKVEEAQITLCTEARTSLQAVVERVLAFSENQNIAEFETLPALLREVSGAMLFLESPHNHDNLQQLAQLIDTAVIQNQKVFDEKQIQSLAAVIASADFYLEQLQNRQPQIKATLRVGAQYLQDLLQAVA